MKKLFILVFLPLLIMTTRGHALVDYSDFTSARGNTPTPQPVPQAAPAATAPQAESIRRAAPQRTNSGQRSGAYFHFGGGVEQVQFEALGEKDKINLTHINGHFQTPWDIFLRTSFWRGQTNSPFLSESPRSQNGNLTTVLGFNWLKLGATHELATVDLYGGASFSGKSDLASSRTDKIAGVESSKRFGDFLIGLGFEYRFSGNPTNEWETNIGNIQKLSAVLGWRATPDIQFLVEGSTVLVRKNTDELSLNGLDEDISFGRVTPKIGLGIRQFIQLELGASFSTRKSNRNDELINARLWDIGGSNGTSLFTSLNFIL